MLLQYKYENKEDIPEQFQELFTEVGGSFVMTEVVGIKTVEDVNNLQESLRKERSDHKAVKTSLAKFGSLDPDEVHSQLDRIHELEAASGGNIDEAKMAEMLEARLKTKTAPLERQLSELQNTLSEKDTELAGYQVREKRATIHDSIRKAAISSKLRDTAINDALIIGESIFDVDENGQVITKDNVGVTPGVDPAVWFTEVQTTRPHWWPESSGAGARGGRGGIGGANNPFSKEHWNMTEQGALITQDRTKADQMAKSAGTSIGGPKPT
jgi:hypothetical protein